MTVSIAGTSRSTFESLGQLRDPGGLAGLPGRKT